MKKLATLLLSLFPFFYFSNTPLAFASLNFTTDYDVTYTVTDNGLTHINFIVVLTNQTTQYYASSYSIQVGFKDITNLKASDPDGPIIPVIAKNNDGDNINLTFNRRVVGINNKLNFNLSFDTKSVAKKTGKIWEINVPGISSQNNFQSFDVHVKVPKFLGKPSYIKPEIQDNTLPLDFTKEQLGKSGISIGFGEEQIYKFNLVYHLKNPNLFKVKTEIAIPPSTNYQDIEIEDITPSPLNVIVDKDGNWISQYQLSPSQKIDVAVNGKARIFLNPKKYEAKKEKLDQYLKEQPYWDSLNVDIKNLALSLKTPYAIYEYVVKTLSYDFSRVTEEKTRVGAAKVLKNPKSAVCLEFTDLFIALSRAAGIPAREIDGYAYTQNSKERPLSLVKDVLHAWPEYYDFDRQSWIMVDPTWENTTKGIDYFHLLDFDHLAFVIKGEDSRYPIPAGGYKLPEDVALKDVYVSFSDSFEDLNPKLTIKDNFYKSYFSGNAIKSDIIVKNVGTQVVDSQEILVTTKFLKPLSRRINLDKIPPLGFLIVPVTFRKTPILTNINDEITITVAGTSISQRLKIYPVFLDKWIVTLGGIIIVLLFILSIFAIKTRSLPFFRQKG